jgi:hypothetical protein
LKTILLRLFGLRCQNRSPASLRHRIDGLRYHIREDLNDFSGMSADLLQIIICGIDDEVMGKQPAALHREDRGLLNGKPVYIQRCPAAVMGTKRCTAQANALSRSRWEAATV